MSKKPSSRSICLRARSPHTARQYHSVMNPTKKWITVALSLLILLPRLAPSTGVPTASTPKHTAAKICPTVCIFFFLSFFFSKKKRREKKEKRMKEGMDFNFFFRNERL